MKNKRDSRLIVSMATCVAMTMGAAARGGQGSQDQKFEMGTFYLCLLLKKPASTAQDAADVQKITQAHLKHLESLAASGKGVAFGPFLDAGNIAGVAVINASSPEEARAAEEADPMVKTGRLSIRSAQVVGGERNHEASAYPNQSCRSKTVLLRIDYTRAELDIRANTGDGEDSGRSHGKHQQHGQGGEAGDRGAA